MRLPWFSRYNLKVRAIVLPKAGKMLVLLTDHKNNCLLDQEVFRLPPNYHNKNFASSRWVHHRINGFLKDLSKIGLEVEYMAETSAGPVKRTVEKLVQKSKRKRRRKIYGTVNS